MPAGISPGLGLAAAELGDVIHAVAVGGALLGGMGNGVDAETAEDGVAGDDGVCVEDVVPSFPDGLLEGGGREGREHATSAVEGVAVDTAVIAVGGDRVGR